MLSLRLGPGLDSQNIREGSDVYLECGVAARPRSRAISWLLEGEQVTSFSQFASHCLFSDLRRWTRT